ncbi:hypothetical protein EVAR_78236_1 [Eumeta japonica]|uniref:Uncharacterized protein n=1 Tax=Eumeta variegata TaxID=151549 RepID=A0A4C1T2V5_EUMVA|nr:hypothetical protein EVAR_78236_1 [Eumeta japonica]
MEGNKVNEVLLAYGNEKWLCQKKNESDTNAVEMQSLLDMCRVSLKYRCRNSDVRERCASKGDVVIRVERGVLRSDTSAYLTPLGCLPHRLLLCSTALYLARACSFTVLRWIKLALQQQWWTSNGIPVLKIRELVVTSVEQKLEL